MAKYDAAGDRVRKSAPVALWIMLAGIVIAVVGFIWCMNTDLKKYAKTENLYTDQNTSDVKNLEFEFDGANVDVVKSGDSQIHVSIENAPEGVYKYGIKDNTFYVSRKKLFSLLKWSGVSKIPFLEDIYPEAKIKVEIPDGMTFDKVEMDCAASEVRVENISCDKLDIDNGMGTLKLVECKAKRSEIDNGMGKMDFIDCDLGKSDIDNGMGEIKMTDSSLDETEIDNGMGAVKMTGTLSGDIDIDNGMGEVELKLDCDGEDFRISGDKDSVDIKGNIGSKNAKYKISVDNGMGDVDIEFKD